MVSTDPNDGDEEVALFREGASNGLKEPDDGVDTAGIRGRGPTLGEKGERELWIRWREDRDASARGTLILGYLWLVRQIALSLLRKIGSAYVELHDLIQLGSVGLIEAVERFNPDVGVMFPAYATKRIKGAILNELQKVSEYHAQYTIRHKRARDRVQHLEPVKNNRTGNEVFEEMTQLAVGLAVGFMLDGTGLFLASEEQKSPYDNPSELLAASDAFVDLVKKLPPQERRLVELHYQDGMEFSDIAAVMDLTRGRISQIHSKAINRLRILFTNRSHLDVQV